MAKDKKALSDVSGKDVSTLFSEIADMKRELLNLRFQRASGELSNTARFREVRKNIARAFTEISKQSKEA